MKKFDGEVNLPANGIYMYERSKSNLWADCSFVVAVISASRVWLCGWRNCISMINSDSESSDIFHRIYNN
jgi:hypothetical protein